MTIYSLDILLFLFGTSLLFYVQFQLLLPDLHTGFSRGRSGGPATTCFGKQYKVMTLQDLFRFLIPTTLIYDKDSKCRNSSTLFFSTFLNGLLWQFYTSWQWALPMTFFDLENVNVIQRELTGKQRIKGCLLLKKWFPELY